MNSENALQNSPIDNGNGRDSRSETESGDDLERCSTHIVSFSRLMDYYNIECSQIGERVKGFASTYLKEFHKVARKPEMLRLMRKRQNERRVHNLPFRPNVNFGQLIPFHRDCPMEPIEHQIRRKMDIIVAPFYIPGIMPVFGTLFHKLDFDVNKDIESIPKTEFKSTENSNDGICSICINSYEDSELVTDLPCRHTFHTNCINAWLKRTLNCPMCRSPVFTGFKHGYQYFAIRRRSYVECTVNYVTASFY